MTTTTTTDLDLRHPFRRPTDTEHHAVRGPLGQIICYPTAWLRDQAEKTWDSIAAQHERVTCPVADAATSGHWHLATPDANGITASVQVHGTAFVTLEEAELAAMVTDCITAECACDTGRADTARLMAARTEAARALLADPKVFPGYHWHAVWTAPGTDTPGAKSLDEESGEWRDWHASNAIYVIKADAVDAVNLFAIHDNSRGVDRRWSASGCACPSGALTVELIAGGAR